MTWAIVEFGLLLVLEGLDGDPGGYFSLYQMSVAGLFFFIGLMFGRMGCGSSNLEGGADKQPGADKSPQTKNDLNGVVSAQDREETRGESVFGNYVIDTHSLRLSKGGNYKDAPPAQKYEKPETVRKIIRASLEKNFIFQALSKSDIESLIDVFKPVSCASGEAIIEQGTKGDFM